MLLASDFDGTLTPIAPTADEVALSSETRELLRRLHACEGVRVAIISGRSLADVQQRVGVEGLFYAGNHGMELGAPGIAMEQFVPSETREELENALAFISKKTASLPGVRIEDKGASANIHWRLACESSQAIAREAVFEAAASNSRLQLGEGKSVWELRPKIGWNKGDALRHLIFCLGMTIEDAIYLGDDVTDEDVFATVSAALTFHVGESESAARYRMSCPFAVRDFLSRVLRLRMKGAA